MAQKLNQKVAQKLNHEKYARTPDSVLDDAGLSLSAKAIYAHLARRVFQGNVVKVGQRLVARKMGCSRNTVIDALQALEARGHVTIRGEGKSRRLYILNSDIFGQKQRAIDSEGGVEELIGRPRRRLATAKSA